MGTENTSQNDPDDPFIGCSPQPVRCEWLTKSDAHTAPTADIIRLVVDDQRGHVGPWVNEVFQRNFVREVCEFIGPTSAVLATYAGTITAELPRLDVSLDGLRAGLSGLQQAIGRLNLRHRTGPNEILLGIDGCIRRHTTHFQTVVHLDSKASVSLDNMTVKIYPAGKGEEQNLLGWRLCEALWRVPDEMIAARRVSTAAGTIVVLVCNDAAIFSARSQANLVDDLKLNIRQHFLEQAQSLPTPAYVVIATHWQGTNPKTGRWSGEAFRQAARYLSEETGATVLTTMRAPIDELTLAAERFAVVGSRSDKVATLLVKDIGEPGSG